MQLFFGILNIFNIKSAHIKQTYSKTYAAASINKLVTSNVENSARVITHSNPFNTMEMRVLRYSRFPVFRYSARYEINMVRKVHVALAIAIQTMPPYFADMINTGTTIISEPMDSASENLLEANAVSTMLNSTVIPIKKFENARHESVLPACPYSGL